MKNRAILVLLIAGAIFSAGLLGFFIGRNTAGEVVEISRPNHHAQSTIPTTQPGKTTTPTSENETTQIETTLPLMLDINTATLEQLDRLPGIGPVLAQRIIDYREENGPFSTVSELTMVDGIGLSILEDILDYVTVGG